MHLPTHAAADLVAGDSDSLFVSRTSIVAGSAGYSSFSTGFEIDGFQLEAKVFNKISCRYVCVALFVAMYEQPCRNAYGILRHQGAIDHWSAFALQMQNLKHPRPSKTKLANVTKVQCCNDALILETRN